MDVASRSGKAVSTLDASRWFCITLKLVSHSSSLVGIPGSCCRGNPLAFTIRSYGEYGQSTVFFTLIGSHFSHSCLATSHRQQLLEVARYRLLFMVSGFHVTVKLWHWLKYGCSFQVRKIKLPKKVLHSIWRPPLLLPF